MQNQQSTFNRPANRPATRRGSYVDPVDDFGDLGPDLEDLDCVEQRTGNEDRDRQPRHDRDNHQPYEGQQAAAFAVPVIFNNTVTVTMNLEMRDLLVQFVNDQADQVEAPVWALMRAIQDPEGCRRKQAQKFVRNRQ